jgi:hypothetical protein
VTDKLNNDDNFAGKAGERLIEIIDRMESEKKTRNCSFVPQGVCL